jgi:putative endonuclease
MCVDGRIYVGSTGDLKRRFDEHRNGQVESTKHRQPIKLVYYEACVSKKKAEERERYFKTGFGRKFLKTRLA